MSDHVNSPPVAEHLAHLALVTHPFVPFGNCLEPAVFGRCKTADGGFIALDEHAHILPASSYLGACQKTSGLAAFYGADASTEFF